LAEKKKRGVLTPEGEKPFLPKKGKFTRLEDNHKKV